MSFYQNPFTNEFRGNWALGDRRFALAFTCPGNAGRGIDLVTVWNEGPYDLTGNDDDGNAKRTLNLRFALDAETWKNWATVTVSLPNSATATARDIVTALNADAIFASYFTAAIEKFPDGNDRLFIKQKFPAERMRFYVVNGQAESVLNFNARAGVAELPVYFSRHTVTNCRAFDDSLNTLILLDVSHVIDQNIINNAVDSKGISLNYSHTDVAADWELLQGRAGDFIFTTQCLDDTGNVTVKIQYNAGAVVGDLAKRTCYTYESSAAKGDQPITITEEPYVLIASDLITPSCTCE